ncbi:MAG: MFS transporter [Cytophagaceae bacterium]|nr:MFS transporter [Cytophagaceae bacterium]MBL0300903.1 MFS transporter [Cytophagaceae bacterium]MBL0323716.1 MFS transporter [Cytophagaceae bacterium]
MLIPELPSYLEKMGGGEFKGLIIALFTLTAGLSRPFSGKLTDKIGRIPVMAFGSLVCFVAGFIYPITTTVLPFLLLRLVHGFSTGFKPTGTAAYIADIVPVNRRGETLGMHGLIGSLGMAFGPALGGWVVQYFDINVLFYLSSLLSFLSIAILLNMKETLPKTRKEKFSISHLALNRSEIFDFSVFPVVVVVFFTSFAYGTIVTLVPDLSQSIGVANKGFYFLIFTISSIAIRFLAGKWSDKVGRVQILKLGALILVIAMLVISFSKNIYIFSISAVLFGIGMGIVSPITQAWTIDLCEDKNRGKAVATMYIALEAGIGFGALLPTFIYQNNIQNISYTFLFSTFITSLALIYLVFVYKKTKSGPKLF